MDSTIEKLEAVRDFLRREGFADYADDVEQGCKELRDMEPEVYHVVVPDDEVGENSRGECE